MKTYKDQMNNVIRLEETPRRIISLVPSQTQLLHFFGLEDEVVGITKFCIHPDDWFREKDRVGGTKSVNLDKVKALKPDLIIGNKEENQQEDILALQEIAPVWMSDIYTLDDALKMIQSVGEITGKNEKAESLVERIQEAFDNLRRFAGKLSSYGNSVIYFIWKGPDMTSGTETFIDDMLTQCGLINVKTEGRYPLASGNEQPDYVFLSSEPYPFKENHIEAFQQVYPDAKIVLVDGEMFSWYGSKLADAPSYFKSLLEQLSID